MSEYVELGEIISVLKQRYDRLSGLRPDFYAGYMAVVKIIEQETRTEDVAPVVHGRWKWDTEDVYECSNCGEKSHVKEVMGQAAWDFCPNCGCRMDGEEGE